MANLPRISLLRPKSNMSWAIIKFNVARCVMTTASQMNLMRPNDVAGHEISHLIDCPKYILVDIFVNFLSYRFPHLLYVFGIRIRMVTFVGFAISQSPLMPGMNKLT